MDSLTLALEATAARARGDWAAERAALDALAQAERDARDGITPEDQRVVDQPAVVRCGECGEPLALTWTSSVVGHQALHGDCYDLRTARAGS